MCTSSDWPYPLCWPCITAAYLIFESNYDVYLAKGLLKRFREGWGKTVSCVTGDYTGIRLGVARR